MHQIQDSKDALMLLLMLLLIVAVKDSSAHFAIEHTQQLQIYTVIVEDTIRINNCQG
jgi:hypothetical protein